MKALSWLLGVILTAAPSLFAEATAIYKLQPGSFIVDDCACGRPPIQEELVGSFVLSPGISGSDLKVDGLDLSDTGAATYAVKGAGSFTLGESPPAQSMSLLVEVNGVGGIQLESETVDRTAGWPAIDIRLKEPKPHDILHIYSLHLVAEPVETVPYELLKGSELVDECQIPRCARPTYLVALTGSFLLGKIDENPLFTTYRVAALDFQNAAGDPVWSVTGGGTYSQGGEVALVQDLELEVTVNSDAGVHLSSGAGSLVQVAFPEIDVDLDHLNPASLLHVYSLHIVARPGSPFFRRGDSNADAKVDISDAIRILFWLFAGDPAPSCLDAADSNGDGRADIADAVYVLLYLFQGGKPPPEPGPDDCGAAPEPSLGCASYPPCPPPAP